MIKHPTEQLHQSLSLNPSSRIPAKLSSSLHRRWSSSLVRLSLVALAGFATSCGESEEGSELSALSGVQASFTLDSSLENEAFFDFPYPSDARLTADKRPDVAGFPNPNQGKMLQGLIATAGDRPGFPAIPVGYFRFDGAISEQALDNVYPADKGSAVLLVDIDASSDERGRLFPTIAKVPAVDPFVPENLLAVASFPGLVLHPNRQYAYVILRSLADAKGELLGASKAFEQLKRGQDPAGDRGVGLAKQYAPLWETLEEIGISKSEIAAATVFTTGDVVKQTHELSEGLLKKHEVSLDGLQVDPDDGADHARFCELHGTVDFPQFQTGEPPFNSEGLFVMGEDGLPVEQRKERARIVINLPKQEMPEGGFPLVMYYHGSGGIATQVVDRGRVTEPDGEPTKGEGPAHVLAAHGLASVGSSHPVSPDRLPGAGEIAYLNFNNLAATRDTFRQGVIEQRLYLTALTKLRVDPALVAGCAGLSLPAGETAFYFKTDPVFAMGQSMGGMYTNMIGAVEPRIKAVVPTGAGGFWSYFIKETRVVGNLSYLAGVILGSKEELDHMHPAMHIFQTAWEAAEPMVYLSRLSQRPLEGHPVRPVYEPVAPGDSYFSTKIYDAFALAYGNQQAGDEVWPEMQAALAVKGLDGFASYPVSNNRQSSSGAPYTGVVVQYEGDGIYDPHAIYGQLDAVKHQYGCFFESFLKTGQAVVSAPAPLGTPCD